MWGMFCITGKVPLPDKYNPGSGMPPLCVWPQLLFRVKIGIQMIDQVWGGPLVVSCHLSLEFIAEMLTMEDHKDCQWSADPLQEPFTSSDLKFYQFQFDIICKIMIHVIQNFAHAMTAMLSWHVQNFGSNGSLVNKLKHNMLAEIWIRSSKFDSGNGRWLPYLLMGLFLCWFSSQFTLLHTWAADIEIYHH